MPEFGPTYQSFEQVGPPLGQPSLPLPAIDARTHALRVLREWISTLEFRRTGQTGGAPIPFCIPIADILIHQPDHVKDMNFPAIAFLPQRGIYESFGLGPAQIDDITCDQFGLGTALVQIAEYHEQLIIEVWGSKIAERRAIVAGLEVALTSQATSYAITLRMKEYFGRTASFAIAEAQYIDEPDNVRNRRRAHMFVDMTVGVVQLVHANTLRPYVQVFADVDC
jgi:hypothetical protein